MPRAKKKECSESILGEQLVSTLNFLFLRVIVRIEFLKSIILIEINSKVLKWKADFTIHLTP
jgi:hypothetical protein